MTHPLQASLESLRSAGAWRFDPVRFHYLEALSRRLPGQPEAVRRLLQAKLQAALADYAQRFARAQQEAGTATPAPKPPPRALCAPLAQLNQFIREASPQQEELPSVGRFRRAWSRSRTHDQVERAASRKPANAGPLNSHVLVLDCLALMQELSPDYLRRFLLTVESLQWLDQAREKDAPQARQSRAARTPRPARK